jgi:endonuclease/exonuclease/phosphatase family metal-dependent hydrolase
LINFVNTKFYGPFGNSDFVIGVQEVDAFQDRSDQVFQVADLASELGAKNFAFVRCVIGTPGFKWRKVRSNEANLITNTSSANDDNPPSYGIGLITNIPVKKWEVLALGKSVIGLPLAFPDPSGGPDVRPKLRLIYVKDEPRYAVAAQLENGFTVVNMHLSFVPFVNLFQLRKIKQWARQLSKQYGTQVLIMGDLNLPKGIPAMGSRWNSLITQNTYPSWGAKIQFDYILSDTLKADQYEVLDTVVTGISDHLPIRVKIK